MNEQDYKNIKPFLKDLLKMQQEIYLACDASVAADVSLKTSKAITLIGRLVMDNGELNKKIKELEGALSFACEGDNGWIEIDTPEDVDCDVEVLLWDGCDHSIDYVETDIDTGAAYFANGSKGITHYKLLGNPTK